MLSLRDLSELVQRYGDDLDARVAEFEIGGKLLRFNTQPAIIGVVNLSPDSWYRESVCLTVEKAVQRGKVLYEQGADIIDIGAESTLLNAQRLDPAAQNTKLIPVIKQLKEFGIPVSVESYQYDVIKTVLGLGVDVINFTGTRDSEEVFSLVADHNASIIICYVEGDNVRSVSDFDLNADHVNKMKEFFKRQIDRALSKNVKKIIIDPGLGFYYRNLGDSAVRVKHQMNIFLNTFRFRTLGFPVCHALPHAFEYFGEEVRCAEPFFAVLAIIGKTDILRTHEVPKIVAVKQTLDIY